MRSYHVIQQGLRNAIVAILIIIFPIQIFGQQKVKRDSISKDSIQKLQPFIKSEGDSLNFYDRIKDYSERSKLTRLFHKWIFTDPDKKPKKRDTVPLMDYESYRGRIIRNIKIVTKDPFGTSIVDTARSPHSWFQKTGNSVHIRSKNMAINKFFLFKEGKALDPNELRETARLLRNQGYVREVLILPDSISRDSIDLTVRVLDSWSMLPKVAFSGAKMKFGILERNFMGIGHRLELNYKKRLKDGNTGFESQYRVPNFRNTFIDATFNYKVDLDLFRDKYISIQRNFYSPLATWAGGAFIQERSLERPLSDPQGNFEDTSLRYSYYDFWGAYAIHLGYERFDHERATNLIFGLRTYNLDFHNSVPIEKDPERFFNEEQLYLMSIGVNTRKFIRDRYIFKDGQIEDIPVGAIFNLTGGIRHKKDLGNWLYMGMNASYGDLFKFGFLGASFEAGSYFRHGGNEQTAFSLKMYYFSHLLELGDSGWKMRQFVKPQFLIGVQRLNSPVDRVGLNDKPYFRSVNNYKYLDYDRKRLYTDFKNGNIGGFDSPVYGTSKYVLSLQTQFYAPYTLWGFHLDPYANISLGYLSGKSSAYGANQLYSEFGVGVIIRNDYLVFNSVQISLSFYPKMPGRGTNIFRSNGFRTRDIGFQDFQVGEPRTIIYE